MKKLPFIFTLLCFQVVAMAQQFDIRTASDCHLAIETYSKKIQEDSLNFYAYRVVAEAYFQLQEEQYLRQAVQTWTTLLWLLPSDGAAYYQRGLCFLFLEDKESACNDWQRALEAGYDTSFNRRPLRQMIFEICGERVLLFSQHQPPPAAN